VTRKTSIDAYNEIESKGLLSERRWLIYKMLFKHGPLTCNEVFQKLRGETTFNNPNIHARLNELRESGCIAEIGTRVCSVTKVNVLLWDVTERLPGKVVKGPKKRDTLAFEVATLKKDNEQLRTMLRLLNARYKKLMAKGTFFTFP
jgi:hypothetical protein